MFSEGHTMKEIDDMSYWDTRDYAEYVSDSQDSGKGRMKQLKPSQLKMIEERKIRDAKERRKK